MSGPCAFYLADLREAVLLAQRLHQYRRGLMNQRPSMRATRLVAGVPSEVGFSWVDERQAANLKDWLPEPPVWLRGQVKVELRLTPPAAGPGAAP